MTQPGMQKIDREYGGFELVGVGQVGFNGLAAGVDQVGFNGLAAGLVRIGLFVFG